MMIAFVICLLATMAGAATGIGGGIIIKPLLDAVTAIGASKISFLSGCTVLTMAATSVFCSRSSLKKLSMKLSTLLASGAAAGGICGKELMRYVRAAFQSEAALGTIQNMVLLALTILVFLFMMRKDVIRKHRLTHAAAYFICGMILGVFSSFLGIGGGPINLMALMYLFSMSNKEAAISSLYIILLSQAASLAASALTGSIPQVDTWTLVQMLIGGALGGYIGRRIAAGPFGAHIDKLFAVMLVMIMCICCYNVYTNL